MNPIENLGPLALASLALVPVVMTASGLMLALDDKHRSSHRVDPAGHEAAPDRWVRTLGLLVLRLPGTLPRWFEHTTAQAWQRAGGRASEASARVATNAGIAALGALLATVLALAGWRWIALVVGIIGMALPTLRLRSSARRRQAAIEVAAPAMLELLAVLVGAGLTFRHALSRVGDRTDGALGDEMRIWLAQMEFGWSPEHSLAELAHRCSAPTVARLSVVARQSIELGTPMAESLLGLADDARLNHVVHLRMRAERIVVRGVILLGLLSIVPFGVMLASVMGVIGLETLASLR